MNFLLRSYDLQTVIRLNETNQTNSDIASGFGWAGIAIAVVGFAAALASVSTGPGAIFGIPGGVLVGILGLLQAFIGFAISLYYGGKISYYEKQILDNEMREINGAIFGTAYLPGLYQAFENVSGG